MTSFFQWVQLTALYIQNIVCLTPKGKMEISQNYCFCKTLKKPHTQKRNAASEKQIIFNDLARFHYFQQNLPRLATTISRKPSLTTSCKSFSRKCGRYLYGEKQHLDIYVKCRGFFLVVQIKQTLHD